jgi:DNA-binding ferritin-like protein
MMYRESALQSEIKQIEAVLASSQGAPLRVFKKYIQTSYFFTQLRERNSRGWELAVKECYFQIFSSTGLRMAGVQPFQDLAGVQTWVTKTRQDGVENDTRSPEKSRMDYEDGKPQRDRVLPLPDGHPKGRDEYRAGPPVLNTPSDSSGSPTTYSVRNNPNAIPNQPDGKPLHQRPRSSGLPGDQYGVPYIDASKTTGLSRRTMTAKAIPSARIRYTAPRKRQRSWKGQVKRDYQRRKLRLRVRNKSSLRAYRKRYYAKNKHKILRYQAHYRKHKNLHKRLNGGGISTRRQKNIRDKKTRNLRASLKRLAVKSVISRMYKHFIFKTMNTKQIERRDTMQANLWAELLGLPTRTRGRRVASSQAYDMATLQVLLAVLRGAHWAHWTSHWQVRGENSYGDHLLMQRLYEGVIEEIDTLAEKIAGTYGSEALNPVEQAQIMANKLLPIAEVQSEGDPIERALFVEEALQKIFKVIYSNLKKRDALTLGLDDFIMATANQHETYLYLLRQRTSNPNYRGV